MKSFPPTLCHAACSDLRNGVIMKLLGRLCNDWNWQTKTTGTANCIRKLNQEGTEESNQEMPSGEPSGYNCREMPLKDEHLIRRQLLRTPNENNVKQEHFLFKKYIAIWQNRELEILGICWHWLVYILVDSHSNFYFCRVQYAAGTASFPWMMSVSWETSRQKNTRKTIRLI